MIPKNFILNKSELNVNEVFPVVRVYPHANNIQKATADIVYSSDVAKGYYGFLFLISGNNVDMIKDVFNAMPFEEKIDYICDVIKNEEFCIELVEKRDIYKCHNDNPFVYYIRIRFKNYKNNGVDFKDVAKETLHSRKITVDEIKCIPEEDFLELSSIDYLKAKYFEE